MYIPTLGSPIGVGSWLGQQPAPAINWCQMRQTIAATARTELARWRAPNGQQFLESHPSRLPVLREYWAAVPVGDPMAKAVLSATDRPGGAWSAAFISFVMRRAGVLRDHGFQFSSSHITFIVGALRNREASRRDRPFWLVDSVEIQREATPEPGDLLCFNRCADGRPQDICDGQPGTVLTTNTYERLRNDFWGANRNAIPSGSSHSAIVVGTTQVGGQRFVETIGGNESQSVRLRRIPIDQNGGIPNPQANRIFGMIKIIAC